MFQVPQIRRLLDLAGHLLCFLNHFVKLLAQSSVEGFAGAFADKQSLLATVGKEGFRKLRQALADAWEENGHGRAGFDAMHRAYVQFAVAHPSHYRVMFGGFIESAAKDDHFISEARSAFQVLVDALVEQQNAGDIRRDDPVLMARFVWALVHGTAMLFINGQLPEPAQREALGPHVAERIYYLFAN
jgi:hypothetical protein